MHKARAMLDALMGPGRDQVEKDKEGLKEKFKDSTVCKSFIVGLCPLDVTLLGGKRKFPVCERIHSELMKEQFEAHPDSETLRREYEVLQLRDLDFAVRECEAFIALEKGRIKEDIRRKKPPLPVAINDRLAQMRRESSALIQRAESLDDDKIREKERLVQQANELLKEREDLLEAETQKAVATLPAEVVCEVCGTSFEGDAADAAHKTFRIHEAYTLVRDKFAELKPRVEESEKLRRKKAENGSDKRAKSKSPAREKDKDRNRDRDKEKDRDRGRDQRRRSRSHRRDRGRRRSRSRSRSRDRRRR